MIFIFPLLTINEAIADEKPLRYQVRDAIEIGNCEKAAKLSENYRLHHHPDASVFFRLFLADRCAPFWEF